MDIIALKTNAKDKRIVVLDENDIEIKFCENISLLFDDKNIKMISFLLMKYSLKQMDLETMNFFENQFVCEFNIGVKPNDLIEISQCFFTDFRTRNLIRDRCIFQNDVMTAKYLMVHKMNILDRCFEFYKFWN